MFHDAKMDEVWPTPAKELTLPELDDIIEDVGNWWRDLAAGTALAAFAVAAAVMFLR